MPEENDTFRKMFCNNDLERELKIIGDLICFSLDCKGQENTTDNIIMELDSTLNMKITRNTD